MSIFFANSVNIKLCTPQVAQLDIFNGKSVVFSLIKRPVRGDTTERLKKKGKRNKTSNQRD